MNRQYGIDVATYQTADLTRYYNCGAKYVFVKATEGTGYFNPKAVSQVRSAHKLKMFVHAYHFATFGNSVSRAKAEAKYFVSRAKYLNISKKRYLALDWETGDGNIVVNSKSSNTNAIIAFMNEVKKAGYKPMLYSGASLLRNNIDAAKVVKKFGSCLWVASYMTMNPINKPDFNWFPSMNGVAIWQFSSNWCGLNVDGNISLINLHGEKVAESHRKGPTKKPVKKVSVVYAPIINNDPNWKIALRDKDGHLTGKYIRTGTSWKVIDTLTIKGEKYYKLGTDQQLAPAKYFKVKK